MSRPATTDAFAPGTLLLGKYRIESKVGGGGMGLVFRATHLALNEAVAIKVLKPEVRLDEEAMVRFQREAQAAARLRSEHAARVTDVGVLDSGTPYMVMEFLDGADLGSVVENQGPQPIPLVVDLVLQACEALAEAHALGIVHRDIKPANLFVTTRSDGQPLVKILDFGISKSASGMDLSLTQTASMLGTPAYMSPEQMRSARRVDARTDIWSMGVVLYEATEGRPPFQAETFSEMCVMAAADPYSPMLLAPELDPIIAKCLAKSPEDRYRDVAELAFDLSAFAPDPNRAQSYLQRTFRLLGRAGDVTPLPRTPLPVRGSSPVIERPPGLSMPGVPALGLTTVRESPQRSSRRGTAIAAAIAVVVIGVGIAIATSLGGTSQQRAVDSDDSGSDPEVVNMQATPPPVPVDAAVEAAPEVGGGPAVRTGSGSGSGSGSAKPIKKLGGTGSGKKADPFSSISGSKSKGSAAAGSGSGKRVDPFGSTGPRQGSGSAVKPKCDPFSSRNNCK